jgi:hypothetical protein
MRRREMKRKHIKMLAVKLPWSSQGEAQYALTIVEQTHRERNFGPADTPDRFKDSNGFVLVSMSNPMIGHNGNKLYVRGETTSKDGEIMICGYDYLQKLIHAVREYNLKFNGSQEDQEVNLMIE